MVDFLTYFDRICRCRLKIEPYASICELEYHPHRYRQYWGEDCTLWDTRVYYFVIGMKSIDWYEKIMLFKYVEINFINGADICISISLYINPFIQVVSKAFSMSRKSATLLSLLLKPVTMRSIILASYNDVLCEFQYPNW